MRRCLALLFVSAQVLAAPRTDEVVLPRDVEPALATLYVRADGALGPNGRASLTSAAAIVARIPGATLAIDVEPRDQNAVPLAEALASLPTASSRVALLQRLAERNAYPWARRDAIERALGLPPTMLTTTSRRGMVERRAASERALPFLGRPNELRGPGHPQLEIAGVVDPTPERLAALTSGETLATTPRREHRSSSGVAGHRLVLPWRAPRDACGPLELLGHLDTEGRLRIEIAASVDPGALPGVQAVARALRRATPSVQLDLARLACGHTVRTREDAAWLLSAVGIDPMTPGFLDGPAPPPLLPSPGPLLDGAPTTFLDALSLQKPPSLRRRLELTDPRR